MEPKPVQNGIGEQSSKVLVSLEDFTSLRGDELLQSIYFVVIGYNLDMSDPFKWVTSKSYIERVVNEISEPRENIQTNGSDEEHTIIGTITDIVSNNSKVDAQTHLKKYFLKKDTAALDRNLNDQAIKIVKKALKISAQNRAEQMSKNCSKKGIPVDATRINILKDEYESELGNGNNTKFYTNTPYDFFTAWHSPSIQIQKGKQHVFPNGYPLFYGIPKRQASIYVAALELNDTSNDLTGFNQISLTEETLKEAVTSFQSIHHELNNFFSRENKRLTYLEERERKISNNFKTIKNTFSLLIKEFERKALNLNHEIRYTNVFTFKENDEWLEGGHQDWGDHRMAMTIKVEVS